MMALTDRVQPWARRFQRAPRDPAAPQPATADETQAGTERRARTAAGDTGDPATTTPRRKTGRFVRRELQER
jgi:hypothetical protein